MIPQIYGWMDTTFRDWARIYFFHVAAALALAVLLPGTINFLFSRFERWLRGFGRRRLAAVVLVFVLTIGIRVALLPVLPVPRPAIHDEFSYLLAADTFASGRLTNPTHPMWLYFEALHINVKPSYQSMYPAAQGLVLAAGQVLTGVPWVGVLVSGGLMCALITWMLQAWMSPGWALLGGLVVALKYSGTDYWINSYWGGAVAAVGGALVVGAMPRLMRTPSWRNSVLLALGTVILANSRPYEGLVLCIPVAIALAIWLVRSGPPARVLWKDVLLPGGAVLLVGAAAMLFYCWRSTGNPLLMPYQANWNQYHITRMFLWQQPRPMPAYNNGMMRNYYFYWELAWWPLTRSRHGLVLVMQDKLRTYHQVIWPWLLVYWLGFAGLVKSRRWFLPLSSVFFLAALLVLSWHPQGHYAAPALGMIIAVAIYGLRYLRLWQWPARLGLRWSRALVLMMVLVFLFEVAGIVDRAANPGYPEAWHEARYRISRQLEQMPGKHLILVRPWGDLMRDWVYNAADIDNAKVVWARDRGEGQDGPLLQYFKERRVWVLYPSRNIFRLEPYSPPRNVIFTLQNQATGLSR